ncbi:MULTISPECIES: ATP-grasp domain-containing protein [Streptomyces]|uniref:ATP-grasp domain-containing protein n=1 Tax=Streptomyces TaxID=1883 RepID=UPI00163BCBA0|nr:MULTISPECIES: ATP-grasp domain-containing protein [Streptomyces]MBC2876160.1 ATP-grasp domain-containing protein [Streptomyces sp. TYQ1024]UBI35607.1 ATP-grasp domain-containing protein [Streptomyces mobaraensis]UKW28202.1 ATP-grasp domain-containing protein [Streptomyces sp. TYQ1024]
MDTRCVVIVDDYGPTRRHAPHFQEAGFECVRVQSTPEVPAVYRSALNLDGYVANMVHSGSLDRTLRQLEPFRPVAVVAGSEIGVELADALSEALGVATNGTRLSSARRDKFLMIEAIAAAGLRAAAQLLVTSEEELRGWHKRVGGRIVLKPVRSAAGDGVHFCASPDESIAAYRKIMGKTNIFSQRNSGVVAQEYLVGAEYIVNTVSSAGRHHVCDIWQTVRIDVNGMRDALSGLYVIPREGDIQDRLVAYATQALDALGIAYGPAHIEIKMTPAGPRLVELGARAGGSDNPYYSELATGESQVTWTVDAYTDPERFARRHHEHYTVQQCVAGHVMLSPYSGTLRSYPYLDAVKRLESLHDIRMPISEGDAIMPSRGGVRHPMLVSLAHPIEEIVLRDMETLRYLDGYAFYDVA